MPQVSDILVSNSKRQLRLDEDSSSTVYLDTLGFQTIGIGRVVDKRVYGAGLRPDEIGFLFLNDLNDRFASLARRIPWFYTLTEARQGVLVNMSFQLGVDGLLQFRATLELIRLGQYKAAATEMLKSKWAQQTPKRAQRMAVQMAMDVWQFNE